MKTLLVNGQLFRQKANILIVDDKIAYIGNEKPQADKVIDLAGKTVIPGGIDQHCHIRDMGLAHKETWTTGSKAAAVGGFTTIFDMPNTKPPTIDLATLEVKREAAKKSIVNCGFFMGATNSNIDDVEKVIAEDFADVPGIKLFMSGSSSNEIVDKEEDLLAFCKLAAKYNKVLAVHSECQDCLDIWATKETRNHARYHGIIRNREASNQGTEQILRISAAAGNKIYIAHTTTKEEVAMIRDYKAKGFPVYAELTPHHLLLEETILETVGNYGKVNPPIRTKEDNEALWQAVYDNIIDTIGSDHAPHTLEEKQKPYNEAPSGFPGLETTFPLLLTQVNKNKLSLEHLARLTSGNQAVIFGLEKRGYVKEGNFADLIVLDMEAQYEIDASKFESMAKYSPYDGMAVQGKVVMTFVNGELKFSA